MNHKYSPAPWHACQDGKCSCKSVWSYKADHPVAKVESGKWGDSHWEAKLIDGEAKLVWNEMDYGEISEEIAVKNAKLIASAPELYEALEETMKWIENWGVRFSEDPEWIEQEKKNKEILGRL